MNQAIVIGNLGRDPEVRETKDGDVVANFSVATNEGWTDDKGKKHEHTEWHRIVVWGKQAASCGEYLTKGRQVMVKGKMRTREWFDDEQIKRFTTEIIADQVMFLGTPGKREGEPPPPSEGRDADA